MAVPANHIAKLGITWVSGIAASDIIMVISDTACAISGQCRCISGILTIFAVQIGRYGNYNREIFSAADCGAACPV